MYLVILCAIIIYYIKISVVNSSAFIYRLFLNISSQSSEQTHAFVLMIEEKSPWNSVYINADKLTSEILM